MATQVYFPPSDTFAFRICNVRPPENTKRTHSESVIRWFHLTFWFQFNLNLASVVPNLYSFQYVHIDAPNTKLVVPGMISALGLPWMRPRSFNQLKVGGGKPVASHDTDTKLFTTTVTFSGLRPIIVGGTERRKARKRRSLKKQAVFLLLKNKNTHASLDYQVLHMTENADIFYLQM